MSARSIPALGNPKDAGVYKEMSKKLSKVDHDYDEGDIT